ncbi:MAG: PAS domain-containing protein, partial [Candidatus Sumerlaeia bacterium]|nr:PAS domain-containing protein [Candidatus Sumerlaeia bacterium]
MQRDRRKITRTRAFQVALRTTLLALLLLVLLKEGSTSLGFAHGLLYTPIVVLSILTRKRRWVIGISATACLMTLLGVAISPPPQSAIPWEYVAANRFLSILVIAGLGAYGSMTLRRIIRQTRLNLALRDANRELERNQMLLRIAGEVGHFGGWSVNLKSGRTRWSEQVAFIHGCEPGFSPSIEEGISFYAPEHQEQIMKAFNACATEGTPYDEELAILNKNGEQVWVRTVGRAV